MIPIEKGVPIPRGIGRPNKYPWADMDVGDSFFVGLTDAHDQFRERNRILNAALYAGKKLNKKFALRAVEGGWRVWRVS